MAGAVEQAHAPTHHNPVTPAQDRFWEGVDQIIQAVFHIEEFAGVLVIPGRTTLVLLHGGIQRMQIAPGTQGLFAGTMQHDHGNTGILRPFLKLLEQQLAHLQIKPIQGLRAVQRSNTNRLSVLAGQAIKQNRIRHRISAPRSMICRAMMTRMISFVPSRIWCTRVSRTSRSTG